MGVVARVMGVVGGAFGKVFCSVGSDCCIWYGENCARRFRISRNSAVKVSGHYPVFVAQLFRRLWPYGGFL